MSTELRRYLRSYSEWWERSENTPKVWSYWLNGLYWLLLAQIGSYWLIVCLQLAHWLQRVPDIISKSLTAPLRISWGSAATGSAEPRCGGLGSFPKKFSFYMCFFLNRSDPPSTPRMFKLLDPKIAYFWPLQKIPTGKVCFKLLKIHN